MKLNKNISKEMDLGQLVNNLKDQDLRHARKSKRFQYLYLLFIPIYGTLSFLDYKETGDINAIYGGICLILSFVIFVLFFGRFYKKYRYVDYSLPTLQMLKNAAERYQPFLLKKFWVFIGIIIMDVGLILSSPTFASLGKQLIFIGAILVGITIGLIIWRFKYKPLRDKALELIDNIEGE